MNATLGEQAVQVYWKPDEVTADGLNSLIRVLSSKQNPIGVTEISACVKQLNSVRLTGEAKEIQLGLNRYGIDIAVKKDLDGFIVFFKGSTIELVYQSLKEYISNLDSTPNKKKPMKEAFERATLISEERANASQGRKSSEDMEMAL